MGSHLDHVIEVIVTEGAAAGISSSFRRSRKLFPAQVRPIIAPAVGAVREVGPEDMSTEGLGARIFLTEREE